MPNLNALALRTRLIRKPDAHKGDMGKVLLIGGAPGMWVLFFYPLMDRFMVALAGP